MSEISATSAVRRALYRQSFLPGVLSFDDFYIDALVNELKINRIDAEAKASSRAVSMAWTYMVQDVQSDQQRGLSPLFIVSNAKDREFVWLPHYQPARPPKLLTNQRCIVQSRWSVLKCIDALNSRQYEALGCLASEAIGAKDVHLTPRGNEGGVDFFARIVVRTDNHLFGYKAGGVRVVGQCKKWGRSVEPGDVRDFLSTLEGVRQRSPDLPRQPPPWFQTARGPIVGWIISESGFTSGAASMAHHHGLLFSDSLDLAELFSACRAFASVRTADHFLTMRSRCDQMLQRFP